MGAMANDLVLSVSGATAIIKDRLEDLPLKETRIAGGLLEDALKSLSTEELSRAVRMLATARTIDI